MRKTARPINWMVVWVCMRTRTEMIRTMALHNSPSIVSYFCQTGIAAMFSACI